jgi:hypothetical protein
VSGTGRELLLVVALAALGAASLRLAGRLGAGGLQRVVAAAPIGTSLAVLEALGLGLFSVGSSPWLLSGAAVVTWVIVRVTVDDLEPAPGDGARPAGLVASGADWWGFRKTTERLLVGGAIGLWVAVCAWIVANPTIGIDAALYHLNDVAAWIHNGRPGSNVELSYDLPFGSYPLTNEVALAWLAGISRGFAAPTLWTPALYLLLLAAGWVGLRAVRVPGALAGLGLAAVGTVPVLLQQLPTAGTDLPGVCWLAVCAALVACSARRPPLLAAALLAGGLAVGTKTTAVPLVVLALAGGVWLHRSRLRGLAPSLLPALVAASVVGGLWYVRDLVEHGSPLWPFLSLPGGDPVPSFLVGLRPSFLSRPLATIHGPVRVYRDSYTWQLSGAWVLLAGGLLAPLVSRRRAVVLAAGSVGLGLLAWANAPVTGAPTNPGLWELTASTNRYVLPVLLAGALAVGLLGSDPDRRAVGGPDRGRGRGRGVGRDPDRARGRGSGRGWDPGRICAVGVLGLGLVVNIVGASKYVPTSIELPPAKWCALGVLAGMALALVVRVVRPREPGGLAPSPGVGLPSGRRRAAGVGVTSGRGPAAGVALPRGSLLAAGVGLLAGIALALGLAWGSSGFLARSVAAANAPFVGPVAWFDRQPGYVHGSAPIAMADLTVATLAGDRYQHPLELIPAEAPCAAVRARARAGWVVVTTFAFPGFRTFTAARCLAAERPLDVDVGYAVYGPASAGG